MRLWSTRASESYSHAEGSWLTVAVGLVGFGFAARGLHMPLILSSGMSIVAVLTRQDAAVRASLPAARVLPDMQSLLAFQPLDLVIIATPTTFTTPRRERRSSKANTWWSINPWRCQRSRLTA